MKLIIEIDKEIYESSKRECEETNDLIIDTFTFAIGNGTPIPDNAINGDVIKAMFPDATIHIFECLNSVNVVTDKTLNAQTFDLDWWYEPYQKGGKVRDYDVECRNHSEMILNAQKGGKE